MGDYHMMEGVQDTVVRIVEENNPPSGKTRNKRKPITHSSKYSSPIRHHRNDRPAPYMVMVSPENSPYASPVRQPYMMNNSSLRSNVPFNPFPAQLPKNPVMFHGRYAESPTHFKAATTAYDDMLTNNASNAGFIHSDFLGFNGIEKLADNTFKYPNYADQSSFPENFNPRVAPNMSHKEKVACWIDTIPLSINNEQWTANCYPAVAGETFEEIECSMEPTPDEIADVQARRVTFLSIKLYVTDPSEKIITPSLQEKANKILQEARSESQKDSESDNALKQLEADIENLYQEDDGYYKIPRPASTPRKRKTRKY